MTKDDFNELLSGPHNMRFAQNLFHYFQIETKKSFSQSIGQSMKGDNNIKTINIVILGALTESLYDSLKESTILSTVDMFFYD